VKPLRVLLCLTPVTSVRLSVYDGDNVTTHDVIRCSANTVHPPVSYYWQRRVNESWQQLQQQDNDGYYGDRDNGYNRSGSVLRLSIAGVYVLRCAAYNVIGNATYNATSDIVTLYVVLPGKCFEVFTLNS